ncbi:MAG TPA: EAL domain-containing protein [Xanthobacteraceae bacterium]|nr:EAL domain-containing protein [Xanthobacteraceae bacterium]
MTLTVALVAMMAVQFLLLAVGFVFMVPQSGGDPANSAVLVLMIAHTLALIGCCIIVYGKYRRDLLRLNEAQAAIAASSARHHDFARSSADVFWEIDDKAVFTYFADQAGVYDDVIAVAPGFSVMDIAARDPINDPEIWRRQLAENLTGVPFRDFAYSIRLADGSLRHFRASGVPITDEQGRRLGMRGISGERTAEVETLSLQRLQSRVLRALADGCTLAEVGDLLCREVERLDPGVVCSILELQGDRLSPLASPSLPEAFSRMLAGLQIGPNVGSCGTACYRGEAVEVHDIASDPLWADYHDLPLPGALLACWSSPIKHRNGEVAGAFAFYFRERRGPTEWNRQIVAVCVDLCALAIERDRARAHIERLAYYNALTGLPNRVRTCTEIDDLLREAQAGGRPLAVLFLDIDHFKDVNETLGHTVGDRLLAALAANLREQFGPSERIGHLGSDEFVVVLPDCTGAGASAAAHRVARTLTRPMVVADMALPLTVSIGISTYPDNGTDAETLLKHADAAMCEAKSAGRATIRLFGAAMKRNAQNRLVYGAALRGAVERGEMSLHYQPQIGLADGLLHGVEALARWRHPELGDVPPGTFIPIAEETGQIKQIGVWAIREACRQMAEWQAASVDIGSISVNLSPRHFHDAELPATVAALLREHRLPTGSLVLEITESVMMDTHPAAMETANALRALGVGLSMDDFGTGYSSLSMLARMPISELKIDQSFMRELEGDRNTQAVVTTITRIGEILGMKVVCEGIETESQLALLRALGCPVGQGYVFSRPAAADDFRTWLQQSAIGTAGRPPRIDEISTTARRSRRTKTSRSLPA